MKETNYNYKVNSEKRMGSGLVFGKFMPLHDGHIYLLNFAQRFVHKLTILVCSLRSEPIAGEIRFQWVKHMFPEANVIHHYDEIPQDPKDDPNFWQIWHDSIKRHCPQEEFDCLFGSEDYGWKMAEKMDIQYIPVNRQRNLVPISGTKMRNDPMKYWNYLPNIVRPYFLKRVCIVGAESTGKSTLTKLLAEHYKTLYVEEYGWTILREYYSNSIRAEGSVVIEDFPTIARGQIASEEALSQRANKILFCDTDLITTEYWAKHYCGECPEWIKEEADKRNYDLYILLDSDTPFADENFRSMKKQADRDSYTKWWEEELTKRGRSFVKISGDWQERFNKACQIIDPLINKK